MVFTTVPSHHPEPPQRERAFIELLASDRELKAPNRVDPEPQIVNPKGVDPSVVGEP